MTTLEQLGPPDKVRFEKGKSVYTWNKAKYDIRNEAGDVMSVEGFVELEVLDSTIMGPGEMPAMAVTIEATSET